jgi:hypothetical protein
VQRTRIFVENNHKSHFPRSSAQQYLLNSLMI